MGQDDKDDGADGVEAAAGGRKGRPGKGGSGKGGSGKDKPGKGGSGPDAGRRQGGKAAGKPVRPAPRVVSPKNPGSGNQIRLKDFVDRVAATSGGRKADVRKVVEATLGIMAEHVAAGDTLNLPPFGRLRLVREKDNGKARVAILRLQLAGGEEDKDASGAGSDPLAEPGD